MAVPNEKVTQDCISELEAQRFSGLSGRALRKLVKNGWLRATEIDGATMIDMHSLEAYVETYPTQPMLPGFEEADD